MTVTNSKPPRYFFGGFLTGLVVGLLLLWRVELQVLRIESRIKFMEGYLSMRFNTSDFVDWRNSVEGHKISPK